MKKCVIVTIVLILVSSLLMACSFNKNTVKHTDNYVDMYKSELDSVLGDWKIVGDGKDVFTSADGVKHNYSYWTIEYTGSDAQLHSFKLNNRVSFNQQISSQALLVVEQELYSKVQEFVGADTTFFAAPWFMKVTPTEELLNPSTVQLEDVLKNKYYFAYIYVPAEYTAEQVTALAEKISTLSSEDMIFAIKPTLKTAYYFIAGNDVSSKANNTSDPLKFFRESIIRDYKLTILEEE